MPLSPHIRAAAAALDAAVLPGTLTDTMTCEGSTFHSPTPLVVTAFDLMGDGSKKIWMCGTCRDNLTVFLAIIKANPAPLPWPLRREFGNRIRALAYESVGFSKEPDQNA